MIIPAGAIPDGDSSTKTRSVEPGDYVMVQIVNGNSQVLKGIPLYHSSITQHAQNVGMVRNEKMYDYL